MTAKIHDLLKELELSHGVLYRQEALEAREEELGKAEDRLTIATERFADAKNQRDAAEAELNDYCTKHPDVRPWQHVEADIVKGHGES